jgi:hypothetical protein
VVSNSLLSVSDVVAVLAAAGYPLSARQVRYVNLEPAQRGPDNHARLFDATDAALLAVFAEVLARCRRLELPRWMARAALRYREADLRRAIVRRMPRFLVVDPITGTATLSETADVRGASIDLRALVARVSAAVAAYRAEHSEVWTGAAYEDLEDVRA